MKKQRIKLKGGDEYDALTGWRKYLKWRSGVVKRIKRNYNKRFRKQQKENRYE